MHRKSLNSRLSRRQFGKGALMLGGAAVAAATPLRHALGADPIKIGLVLPYSGVYANFGEGITNGFEYALKKRGGQLAGRPVEILKGDDQLDPKVGGEVTQKLVTRDKVDFVVGTVGSNVVPVMQKICTENNTFLVIPTAASNEVTRARCHPLVFRISHSNWQITSPAGTWLFKQGKKRVITMGMNYAAGKEEIEAFVETFKPAGGEVLDQKWPGIRELDYQAYFADVLPKRPDAIFTFFAGSNAVEFVKQYAQAGLKERVPLYGAAYLTELDAARRAGAGGRRRHHQRALGAHPRQRREQGVHRRVQAGDRQGRRPQLDAWPRCAHDHGARDREGEGRFEGQAGTQPRHAGRGVRKSARTIPFLQGPQSGTEHLCHRGEGRSAARARGHEDRR